MKKIIYFCVLFSLVLNAQNQRFIYEYSFRTDSTNLEKEPEKELMYLDISKKGSKYYSRDSFVADSIMDAEFEKQRKINSHNVSVNFKDLKFGKVKSVVEKSYPDFKILFFNQLGSGNYKVEDDRTIEWKITPEKEKIGEFSAQKATAEFAGRVWYAWFTTEIPIQDGPYKFRGLPGLIIKISDKSNTHNIELKGSKKLSDTEIWKTETEKSNSFNTYISVNQKQYKNLFIDNRNDPMKNMRQMLMKPDVKIEMKDQNGKPIDINTHIREREKSQKEVNKRNNNLLELDLLK